MPSAPILGSAKNETVDLDESVFGAPFHEPIVHETVRAELAARRQGTHSTKTRGKVRGGGAKPYRQKGTGRARQGSIRAPQFAGGGTVFGPQPRHYTFKINRKERRVALRSALSLHAGRESLAVLDAAPFTDTPTTKQAHALVEGWSQPRGVLVVVAQGEDRVALSFRNLFRTSVLPAENVGVADLIGASAVLASRAAIDALTQRALGSRRGAAQEASA
jgi:large subunit ribosomal protein L4